MFSWPAATPASLLHSHMATMLTGLQSTKGKASITVGVCGNWNVTKLLYTRTPFIFFPPEKIQVAMCQLRGTHLVKTSKEQSCMPRRQRQSRLQLVQVRMTALLHLYLPWCSGMHTARTTHATGGKIFSTCVIMSRTRKLASRLNESLYTRIYHFLASLLTFL